MSRTCSDSSSVFAGFRFPPQVIAVAVRWYLRYGRSCRDVRFFARAPRASMIPATGVPSLYRLRAAFEQFATTT